MYIYIALAILLTIAQFANKNKNLIFSTLVAFVFCILAFRAENIGIDLPGYVDLFESNDFSRSFLEPAYVLYSNVLHSLSNSVLFFIIVTSLTTLAPVVFVIIKESNNRLYSLFYFVISTHYFFLFSGLRQSISISFLLLAFYYLRKRKEKLSFLWYVLAGLFHTASWIFVFIYIIDRMTLKKKFLYILLIASTIASFVIDPYYFFTFVNDRGGELVNYSNQGEDALNYYSSYSSYLTGSQLPFLRIIQYTIPYVFIAFIILHFSTDLHKKKEVYSKIFIFGVIINNLVIGNPIGFRLMKAPLLLAMLLIPLVFDICKNRKALYFGYSFYLMIIYSYYILARTVTHFENDIIPYQLNSVLY